MTDQQFQMLYAQIVEIREALEALRSPTRSVPPASSSTASTFPASFTGAVVPKPTMAISDPGAVRVHFGKNSGVRLCDLPSKSVAWYAQDREPQLRKDGTPFPPRDEDVRLREAARSLIHGSISSDSAPASASVEDDENNPY